jgi:hypothetical protein
LIVSIFVLIFYRGQGAMIQVISFAHLTAHDQITSVILEESAERCAAAMLSQIPGLTMLP